MRRLFRALAAKSLLYLTVLLSASPAFGNTLTVANTNDSGSGSLRAAIDSAGPGDTIVFALTYPAVISLTSGSLTINTHLTLAGPGASSLTVDASNNRDGAGVHSGIGHDRFDLGRHHNRRTRRWNERGIL